MSNTDVEPRWISSAVYRAWSEEVTEAVPTIYPGVEVDTTAWSEWYEIWVEQWQARPQRQRAPEFCDVRVTVHAFVRPTANKGRAQELMGVARTVLTGRTLAVENSDSEGGVVGYIKLGNGDVKELTRVDADASRHGLQHLVGLWRGLAQRTDSPL